MCRLWRSSRRIGTTGGYGISNVDRVQLAPGTCLYDKPHGEVVGVNTRQKERYGVNARDGWGYAYVDTTWGFVSLAVHEIGRADDGGARWESCAKP